MVVRGGIYGDLYGDEQAVANFELIVTPGDREMAREAIVAGWNNCKARPDLGPEPRTCDCILGRIDGCKARVEAVARMIAFARKQ